MAANVVVKLINILLNSVVRPYVLELVHPLSSSLSLRQVDDATSCATALNLISKSEKAIWEILKRTDIVAHIVDAIKDITGGLPQYRRHLIKNEALLNLGIAILKLPNVCCKIDAVNLGNALPISYMTASTRIAPGSVIDIIDSDDDCALGRTLCGKEMNSENFADTVRPDITHW
ncbi:hypothetical protein CJ030_MR1G027475 [Morella rubra]|uniref:At1g04390 ARM repeat domain-containing protein n=1 Tax=Morella rubra TaxID=262757 RepID=A0A6A1WMY8_9ROSI|nr:hypothetical protein CJ030_MR1G027475 [Morella rubra]